MATVRELDLRTAVLGVGALAAGFVVGRRLRAPDAPSTDELRERAGEALPGNGVDVPIGDHDDEATDGSEEGADAESDDVDLESGAEPSLEEIDERTEDDARSEPAAPGEMQVDEEVLEEAVDDEDDAE